MNGGERNQVEKISCHTALRLPSKIYSFSPLEWRKYLGSCAGYITLRWLRSRVEFVSFNSFDLVSYNLHFDPPQLQRPHSVDNIFNPTCMAPYISSMRRSSSSSTSSTCRSCTVSGASARLSKFTSRSMCSETASLVSCSCNVRTTS